MMAKRFPFTALVLFVILALVVALALFGLVFSRSTDRSSADAASQLEKVETYSKKPETYNKTYDRWYPARTEAAYQEITREQPGSDYALEAHKNLVISYILAKRDSDAQQALDELVRDFSGHSSLPAALYDIAKRYEQSREYEKARRLYQQIIQQYPGSLTSGETQLATERTNVLSHIESKDDDAATAAATDSLIANFAGHSELPVSLYDIARRYERAKKYDKAAGLYQQIIQQYSGSSAAGRAMLAVERTKVMLLIGSADKAAAAVIDRLIADFPGHPDLARSLYDIASKGYERAKKYRQAEDIYQRIIQLCPDSPKASGAPLNIAKVRIFTLIDAGEYEEAMTATGSLIAEFSGHSLLPETLRVIAREYERAGRYQQSDNVYQQIVGGHGESSYAGTAEAGIARNQALIYVDAGNDAAVDTEVDKLVNDYRSPVAVSRVARQYQDKEKYREAIGIYERVINEFGGSGAAAEACCFAGECCRKLGDYEKSIQYYRKVLDEYGGYRLAWNAQFMVGHSYEKLKESGALSKSEADAEIRAAYRQVIEKYPDCRAAKHARRWLSQHN